MKIVHQPVLLHQVIDGLRVLPGKVFIDCTVGSGGHAEVIIAQGGRVYGLDVDPAALARTKNRLGSRITLTKANFSRLAEAMKGWGLEQADGILLDLGLSTEQIEDQSRGFSWEADSPLDMRADPDLTVTAADLVNGLNPGELAKLLSVYGEEPRSGAIARVIAANRPLKTTGQLAALLGKTNRRHNPATLVFQALRIAVNDEINNLKAVLPQAEAVLRPAGRLAVISFHSLEDRIVKNYMKQNQNLKVIGKKPIISKRPHAVLRLAEKI